jgi:uncharacterized protein with LGFP repeats
MTTHINGFDVFGAIEVKWFGSGAQNGILGPPTSNEQPTFDGTGRFQTFMRGQVSWHPAIGAFLAIGDICARWRAIGAEQFGYPITDESPCPDQHGRYNHFRDLSDPHHPDASIYWTPQTGAVEVFGGIRDHWAKLGWEAGPLRYPVAPEGPTFDGVGRNQPFQMGVMSWHPETGAFSVIGDICARWRAIGAEQFGYPITDESPCPDRHGRYNHFRTLQHPHHPDASIYWTPETGAVEVFGGIRDHWAKLGWEMGPLRYPVAPEGPTFDGVGRNQPFQMGAMSWHPSTGAFSVIGEICARWRAIGAEQFGYPITDETSCPDQHGRYNHFRRLQDPNRPDASIYWSPETHAIEVYGAIRDRWARRGWETSNMHYPVEPEKDWPERRGRQQIFQGGRIVWNPAIGALFDPLVFEGRITSGGLAALGGSWKVSIAYNGATRWEGHAHDSGADGYDYSVTAAIATPICMIVALLNSGHVGGTFTSGDRNDDWNEEHPSPAGVTLLELNDATGSGHIEYTSDIGSSLESVVDWVVKFSVGTALSGVSGIVFVGVELTSLIGSGSLGPGARILNGVLWMAGPLNTLLALGADAIAGQGYETTPLSYEAYDWANMQVYNGTLPPREDIVISNMIGMGGDAFTFPRFDGKTVINLGPTGFSDPRNYKGQMGRNLGRTFIHELCHACQIAYSSDNIAYVARALASNSRGHSQDIYNYAGPTVDFRSLNLEQQAQIVEDWYVGGPSSHGPGHTNASRDSASPYYHFITNNVWQKAY